MILPEQLFFVKSKPIPEVMDFHVECHDSPSVASEDSLVDSEVKLNYMPVNNKPSA